MHNPSVKPSNWSKMLSKVTAHVVHSISYKTVKTNVGGIFDLLGSLPHFGFRSAAVRFRYRWVSVREQLMLKHLCSTVCWSGA